MTIPGTRCAHLAVCPTCSDTVASRPPEQPPALVGTRPLTDRELEVLDGLARGETREETGRRLYLSTDTIKAHTLRVFRVLGVTNAAAAVAVGIRTGLIR